MPTFGLFVASWPPRPRLPGWKESRKPPVRHANDKPIIKASPGGVFRYSMICWACGSELRAADCSMASSIAARNWPAGMENQRPHGAENCKNPEAKCSADQPQASSHAGRKVAGGISAAVKDDAKNPGGKHPQPKRTQGINIRKAAISPANAADGRASDHWIVVPSSWSGRETPASSAADTASALAPSTRICGALHCGQKGIPSSTFEPHL